MRETLELLRQERRARVFFAVLSQSALGMGAGYVALLLVAFDRYDSAWAISAVLVAGMVPAMLLGPVFGAAADRWSRRGCAVFADVLRAGACLGAALVDSFEATTFFALLAGCGTGLFNPAALAALPSLVDKERLPAATSLYGAITDLGFTVGPALAAGVLVLGGAETILLVNAATFVVSAGALMLLPFGGAPEREPGAEPGPLFAEARAGLAEIARTRGLTVLLLASSAALFFGGIFNVGELLFARDALGTTDAAFSMLVTAFGVGFVAGSLSGSKGGTPRRLKGRYLFGLLFMAAGLLGSAAAPAVGVALLTFAVQGFGNGLVLVYERQLFQATVPDRLAGRVFGAKDALGSWAFAAAFVAGGGLIAAVGVRTSFLAAGIGGLVVWALAASRLRGVWTEGGAAETSGTTTRKVPGSTPVAPTAAIAAPSGRHSGSNFPDGPAGLSPSVAAERARWLELLDDLGNGGDNSGIELGTRVRR